MDESNNNDQDKQQQKNKIVPIEQARLEMSRKAEQGKSSDVSSNQIQRTIFSGLNGLNKEPFPYKIEAAMDTSGNIIIYKVNERQELSQISPTKFASDIKKYSDKFSHISPKFEISAKSADSYANTYLYSCEDVGDQIAEWRTLSEPGLTLKRLPFDFTPGDYPLVNEIMCRTKNVGLLRAYIGAIFTKGANVEQYIWWYGDGKNGKGTITNWIADVLGSAALVQVGTNADDMKGHYTEALLGKRFLLLTECENQGLIKSAMFKALVGKDHIMVNPKFKKVFSGRMHLQVIITSNKRPRITGGEADMRRLIYCESGKPTPNGLSGSEYARRVALEMPHFVFDCIQYYKELGSPIRMEGDARLVDELLAEMEERNEWLFEKYFRYDPTAPVSVMCDKNGFQSFLCAENMHNNPIRENEFRDYLERKIGFRCSTPKYCAETKATIRVYPGLVYKLPTLPV